LKTKNGKHKYITYWYCVKDFIPHNVRNNEEKEKDKPYVCPVCGKKYSEEEALEINYVCCVTLERKS